MADDIQQSYDAVPYESLPFSEMHPDRLAALATLFGLSPAPVEGCRVLELGCASGGNLVPMAVALPGSSFVGVDLSPRQIADGQEVVRALNLSNIELRSLDIRTIGADFGQFDYIICHGVFSWVPADVQDKIFTICTQNLPAGGVAVVSYNTYPGWHDWLVARDVMTYHVRGLTDPLARVQQARAFLGFVAQSAAESDGPFRQKLLDMARRLADKSDSYLLHEHLTAVNEPLYFSQFIDRAKSHGLQYLADAKLSPMTPLHLSAEAEQTLNQVAPTLVQREQVLDFLNNQSFRRSLLCRPQATINRSLKAESLTAFRIATLAQPASDQPDIASSVAERFVTPDGLELSTADPLLKAALVHLAGVSPWPVPFGELLTGARVLLCQPADAAPPARDIKVLGSRLLNCFLAGLVELHVRPPSFRIELSHRPVVSPLARWQVTSAVADRVTNLRHELIRLTDFARKLLPLLDGRHDCSELLRLLKVEQQQLDETLHQLARSALLAG
jgi:methyltransferase-like protein/2-polyprenyl-3-methyl-5-hydroxy-6-metoxy-1,4-benzoquinol methylase